MRGTPAHIRHLAPQQAHRGCGSCNLTEIAAPAAHNMSESFAALFEESLQRTEMRTGEVITAEVVRIEHSFVVVNAGLTS